MTPLRPSMALTTLILVDSVSVRQRPTFEDTAKGSWVNPSLAICRNVKRLSPMFALTAFHPTE
jgi:hypothetical protein